MYQHPYFDLQLHDDEELSIILGNRVAERVTLHEWPLSCVQRLICGDGTTHIYKVQAPPTVEPAFYRAAYSPLLVPATTIPIDNQPDALLLADLRAPTIDKIFAAEQQRLSIVEEILAQIGAIRGDLPAHLELRTVDQWLAYGETIIGDLRTLVAEGQFQSVTDALIDELARQIESPALLAAFDGEIGYLHTDLTAENVLRLGDEYRVIDWQRPIWGPVALDRATLLESVGLHAATYVAGAVLKLRTLLTIGWLTDAARRWFPAGAPFYDRQIVEAAIGRQPE